MTLEERKTEWEARQEADFAELQAIFLESDYKGLLEKFEVKVTKQTNSQDDTEIFLRHKYIHTVRGIHGFRHYRDGLFFDRWARTDKRYTRSELIEKLNSLAK